MGYIVHEVAKSRTRLSDFTLHLTVIRTWNGPKRPSTDDWIKNMWYTYTMGYYSAIKNNEIMPFAATRMDLETGC